MRPRRSACVAARAPAWPGSCWPQSAFDAARALALPACARADRTRRVQGLQTRGRGHGACFRRLAAEARALCSAPLALALTLRCVARLRSQALAKLFEPAFAWVARRYQVRSGRCARVRPARCPKAAGPVQAAVGAELKKYGLRYDDLLDPTNNLDVNEAMQRLPQAVRSCGGLLLRHRRALTVARRSWICATSV